MSTPKTQPPLKNRSLLQSWLALPPRIRLFISWGMVTIGGTGWAVSEYLEKRIPSPDKNLKVTSRNS